jgi:predicted dehydrogenase
MGAINIGFIGYGGWTRTAFLPTLQRDGRATIVSVAARTQKSRDLAVSELGQSVRTFASAGELLAGPPVQAVMIAVPDEVHEETLSAALDAGVAVYYEPPIADTRANLRPMIDRLRAAPQITHADLEPSFSAVVNRVCELTSDGTIGRIHTARIILQSDWGPIADSDLCTINHLAPWYVDILNRIVARRPQRVMVLDGAGVAGRRQNQSIAELDYDGAWGFFHANINAVGGVETSIEVGGVDGDIVADVFSGEILIRTRKNTKWRVEVARGIEPYVGERLTGWPGMHESVAAFLDAIETGNQTSVGAEAVAHLQLVGLAAEESIDSGGWVEVEGV